MRIKRHCFELLMIVRVEELNKGRGGEGEMWNGFMEERLVLT